MSIFRTGLVSNFTRGGQTTVHFIRMIWQVVRDFALACVAVFGLSAAATLYFLTATPALWASYYWVRAWVQARGLQLDGSTLEVTLNNGRVVTVTAEQVLSSAGSYQALNTVYDNLVYSIVVGALVTIAAIFAGMKLIHSTGRAFANEEYVRGGKMVSSEELKSVLKKEHKCSQITVAGLPIPKDAEVTGFLIAGAQGTGKSVTIKEMLTCIRRLGHRAVIYDPSGDMVAHFYRPGIDHILNPFDERTAGWSIWQECRYDYDYDQVAAAFISDPPSSGESPFWVLGSRIVLSAMAQKMAGTPGMTNAALVKAILTLPIEDIIRLLQGTEGAAIMDEKAEKTAASVRANLATSLRPLKYMPDGQNMLSLRSWVLEDDGDGCVFITSKDDKKAIVVPLITTWMDIAASAILSLSPSSTRRIWTAIDELPSLNRLPSLLNYLAQARKYGGCPILGVQSYPQLKSIYGKDTSDAIVGLCATRLSYRFNENESATWASKGLGEVEQLETNEGISYGVNDIRDGVNLSRTRQLRPIVLPTEIMDLPDLTGYIRFGRQLPVARFKQVYVKLPIFAPAYVDREIEQVGLTIEQTENTPNARLNEMQGSGIKIPIRSGATAEAAESIYTRDLLS